MSNIYLEDWEQVKEFIDNQVKLLNNKGYNNE